MKGMRKWKRFLAMLLVALMVSTLVPVNVFAEELDGGPTTGEVQSEEPTEEEQSEVEPVVEVQLEDGLTAEVPSEEPTTVLPSDESPMLSASRSMAVMQAALGTGVPGHNDNLHDNRNKKNNKIDRYYYDYSVFEEFKISDNINYIHWLGKEHVDFNDETYEIPNLNLEQIQGKYYFDDDCAKIVEANNNTGEILAVYFFVKPIEGKELPQKPNVDLSPEASYIDFNGTLTVVAKSAVYKYDGKEKKCGGTVQQVFIDKNTGDQYTVYGITGNTATRTDAGDEDVILTIDKNKFKVVQKVPTGEEYDVTSNVQVKTVNGKLIITKRKVTLTSASLTKEYDGKPFTDEELKKGFEVGGDGFADGEGLRQVVWGSINYPKPKDVGTYEGEEGNAFRYVAKGNTDLGANYVIEVNFGTLTIEPIKPIKPTYHTVTFKYNSFGDSTKLWNNDIVSPDEFDKYVIAKVPFKVGEPVKFYEMPEMKYTGYKCTFAGWFDEDEKEVTENFEMPDHDVVLYGYYLQKRAAYTVTYKWDREPNTTFWADNIDGIWFADDYFEGNEVTVRENLKDIEGHTFRGWFIDDKDVSLSDGKFKMPSHDVVIKGHYDVNSYLITYDIQGNGEYPELKDINLPNNFIAYASEQYGAFVQVFGDLSADGYTFKGWTADVRVDDTGYFTVPARDVKFVANWEKNEVKEDNDGENVVPVNPGPTDGDPDGPTGDGPTGGPTGGGTDDTVTVEPTPVFPAPLNGPVNPVVVNTLDNPFPALVADADNDQLPMLVVEEPENEPAPTEPAVIQVADEETPLANVLLDHDHLDCILHLLLMLGAMVIFGVYTHNHKKLQSEIQELEEAIEGRKSGKITSARKHVA